MSSLPPLEEGDIARFAAFYVFTFVYLLLVAAVAIGGVVGIVLVAAALGF